LQSILTPTPLPAGTYLSDLTPTSASNAWGPIENDRSNGENSASDGSTLALNGVGYRKGLGVHAPSDITYNIAGGSYTDFVASIGVDDEVGSAGSVTFQVYINNILKYTSPAMTGGSATIPISIPIPGGSTTLRLVVNDNGDASFDHADWAMARLVNNPPTTPVITAIQNDTGSSGSDVITSDHTLVLAGTSDPNNVVTITRIGTGVIGTATANGSGAWSFDYTGTLLPDGQYQFTAQAADGFNRTSAVSTAFSVTIDSTRPTVSDATFNHVSAQNVVVTFSEDLGGYAPSGTEAILTNLTTASSVSLLVSYNGTNKTATFTFPSLLADGNYRLTLKAGSMPDRAGNTLQSDFTRNFFMLGGDANHDRFVNDIDLGILSMNWNTTGRNFSSGDFNYDGNVDVADFKILTDRWQAHLPEAVSAEPVVAAAPPPSSSSARRRSQNISVVN
jgi:hypothetical protein